MLVRRSVGDNKTRVPRVDKLPAVHTCNKKTMQTMA